MLMHIRTSPNYEGTRFVTMRSTDSAVPFYLKEGCVVFDWLTTESYIPGGNQRATEAIRYLTVSDAKKNLLKQGILQDIQQEIPFLIPRVSSPSFVQGIRRSLRISKDLSSLAEEKLLSSRRSA